MTFIRWSHIDPTAKKDLKPNLGTRTWNQLAEKEKELIYKHCTNKGWFGSDENTYLSVYRFDGDHKALDLCRHILGHGGPHYIGGQRGITYGRKPCCGQHSAMDFHNILYRQKEYIVYELISYYAEQIRDQQENLGLYNKFVTDFNDISDQFGLNILLTDSGLILRQDKKIIENVYEPVLKFLTEEKWQPVNKDMSDAFEDCLKNTPENFSSAITHTVSALQGFMQIIVRGEIGKGDLSGLVSEAKKKNLIPKDKFSEEVFDLILSTLMIERGSKGDAHPKKEGGDEKTARLVLNLVMVFMQHCIQNK